MNRKRLALSLAIVGILISPTLFRVWDSWLQAYNNFATYQDIHAYHAAVDAAERKGITEQQFWESAKQQCELLQPNANSKEAWDCFYRIRKDRIGAPLSSYLSALGEVLIKYMVPWLVAVAIGGVGGAVLGYVLPLLVRLTLVGVPAIVAAYVRWLREPE